MVEDAMRWTAI